MSDVVPAPDFVQPSTIDFNSLYEKAMDLPTETAPEPAAVADSPASPAETKILDLPEDAQVRIKVDGQEQVVPVREYKDGIQREAAFTKRMQQLADQRREAESVMAQRAAELERQAQMLAYAEQQLRMRQQPAPAPEPVAKPDPNEIATLGEVQQSLASFQAQLAQQQALREQQFFAQLQQAGQQLREEQAVQADASRYTAALNATLDQEDFRVLRDAIPYAEESIRFQVAQLNPETIDEAIQFTDQVVKEWADKLRTSSTDYLKRQEVAKARAKMAPPAGSPPPPTRPAPRQAFKKNGQIDWDVLRERSLSYLEG